jgi:hypothetical protein
MSWQQSVSLPQATGTKIDSGCKHILTCRVDSERLRICAKDDIGENPKYKMQQWDLALNTTQKSWKESGIVRKDDAYALVITNFSDLPDTAQKLIKYVYHNACSLYERDQFITYFNNTANPVAGATRVRVVPPGDIREPFFEWKHNAIQILQTDLAKICDCGALGVALTEASATGLKSDTAGSVLVGGMITVVNGDFSVQTGDKLQFYWPFERDCFDSDGFRKLPSACRLTDPDDYHSLVEFENTDPGGNQTMHNMDGAWEADKAGIERRNFATRGREFTRKNTLLGLQGRITPMIKPYREDGRYPRWADYMRVFAHANHSAGPGQQLDIRLGNQSN